MKTVHILCLWLLWMPFGKASAQLVEKVIDALENDSLTAASAAEPDSERLTLSALQQIGRAHV